MLITDLGMYTTKLISKPCLSYLKVEEDGSFIAAIPTWSNPEETQHSGSHIGDVLQIPHLIVSWTPVAICSLSWPLNYYFNLHHLHYNRFTMMNCREKDGPTIINWVTIYSATEVRSLKCVYIVCVHSMYYSMIELECHEKKITDS